MGLLTLHLLEKRSVPKRSTIGVNRVNQLGILTVKGSSR
uniref:Uncharacterized protein n=1 Tax=Cucumis melo TaxID=3656 RepID=A0A9I9EI58_CUCME